MKKAVIFIVLVMLVIGSCAAQSANNDAQRIVGTWTVEANPDSREDKAFTDGTIWVFNANGTGTRGGQNFFYGISVDGSISYFPSLRDHSNYVFSGGQLYFSPDGKRMILNDVRFQKK